MIKEYQSDSRSHFLEAPRLYGLDQVHKHLKEMQAVSGLEKAPVFCPVVADFYSGLVIKVPLFREDLAAGFGIDDIRDIYRTCYTGPVVKYTEKYQAMVIFLQTCLQEGIPCI